MRGAKPSNHSPLVVGYTTSIRSLSYCLAPFSHLIARHTNTLSSRSSSSHRSHSVRKWLPMLGFRSGRCARVGGLWGGIASIHRGSKCERRDTNNAIYSFFWSGVLGVWRRTCLRVNICSHNRTSAILPHNDGSCDAARDRGSRDNLGLSRGRYRPHHARRWVYRQHTVGVSLTARSRCLVPQVHESLHGHIQLLCLIAGVPQHRWRRSRRSKYVPILLPLLTVPDDGDADTLPLVLKLALISTTTSSDTLCTISGPSATYVPTPWTRCPVCHIPLDAELASHHVHSQASDPLVDEPLLRYYAQEWDRYTTGAGHVHRLLTYLNRHG